VKRPKDEYSKTRLYKSLEKLRIKLRDDLKEALKDVGVHPVKRKKGYKRASAAAEYIKGDIRITLAVV